MEARKGLEGIGDMSLRCVSILISKRLKKIRQIKGQEVEIFYHWSLFERPFIIVWLEVDACMVKGNVPNRVNL